MSVPLEHDYIGLSEASLMERSSDKISSSDVLNLKETELRLGLPGSAPEDKYLSTRRKRGFSGKWDLSINCISEANWGKEDILFSPRKGNEGSKQVELIKSIPLKENGAPHSSKAQVVGWPPIRSFRKSTLATTSSKKNDIEAKGGSSCLYVKVSMDGAPYLRKVDIKSCNNYGELSSALENMFSCFSIVVCGCVFYFSGQCASDRHSGEDEVSGGSEYVLTYEDKDGDWMLVGDVPWEMFSDSCKRMRIMKSSEAIGLAPRSINKCKNQN